MRKAISVACFFILAIWQIGCNASARSESMANPKASPSVEASPFVDVSVTKTPQVSRTPEKINTLTTAKRTDFLGCWSMGNGDVMRITKDQVFVSTNRFKPVNYIEQSWADGKLVIRLQNRPQFYVFQEFVSFEFDRDAIENDGFPLVSQTYLSLDDLENQKVSGEAAWVKDNCDVWFPKSKRG